MRDLNKCRHAGPGARRAAQPEGGFEESGFEEGANQVSTLAALFLTLWVQTCRVRVNDVDDVDDASTPTY